LSFQRCQLVVVGAGSDKAEMLAQAQRGGAEVRASSLAELIKRAPMPIER